MALLHIFSLFLACFTYIVSSKCGESLRNNNGGFPTASLNCGAGPVRWIEIGDWGDRTSGGKIVAQGVRNLVKNKKIDFVISLGDNAYNWFNNDGSEGDGWWQLWDNRFNPREMDIPWYAIIGNGDVSGWERYPSNWEKQYDPPSKFSKFWKMPGWTYEMIIKGNGGIPLNIFMLNTYWRKLERQGRFDSKLNRGTGNWNNWLDSKLRKAKNNGEGYIVNGHHPVGNRDGDHQGLETLLNRYSVGLYSAGHIHKKQWKDKGKYNELILGNGGHNGKPMGFALKEYDFDGQLTTHFYYVKGNTVEKGRDSMTIDVSGGAAGSNGGGDRSTDDDDSGPSASGPSSSSSGASTPICSISGCQVCRSATRCKKCRSGYDRVNERRRCKKRSNAETSSAILEDDDELSVTSDGHDKLAIAAVALGCLSFFILIVGGILYKLR